MPESSELDEPWNKKALGLFLLKEVDCRDFNWEVVRAGEEIRDVFSLAWPQITLCLTWTICSWLQNTEGVSEVYQVERMFPNATSLEGQGMVPHLCSSFAQLCDQNKTPFEFAASVTTGFCSQLKKAFINVIIEESMNYWGRGDRNSFKSTSNGSERCFTQVQLL